MRILQLIGLVLALAGISAAQQGKCFKHQGDGFDHELNLTVNGSKVTGELIVSRTNSEAPTRLYKFAGTISKGEITFRFVDGSVPNAFPQAGSQLTGKLITSGGNERLVLKLSDGTGRQTYSAAFESCGR